MRSRRRRAEAAVAAVLICLLRPAAAWAGPAAVVSDPPDGTALHAAPAAVELTTRRRPDIGQSHVTVWDTAGRSKNSAPLSENGNDLSQPIAISAAGNFACAYHIVFSDGSDTTGVIHFSVGTGVPPSASLQPPAGAQHDHGVNGVGLALLLIDLLAVIGVLVALFVTRRGPPRPGHCLPNMPRMRGSDAEVSRDERRC
ncbi:MAG TPA: copper resistance protein CopC [Actinoplanes sp.]|jgi:methionine-rich copper-binding protein CopC|nr:copper resistance protein CopC [Actinoplanes sp.]